MQLRRLLGDASKMHARTGRGMQAWLLAELNNTNAHYVALYTWFARASYGQTATAIL